LSLAFRRNVLAESNKQKIRFSDGIWDGDTVGRVTVP
jgi:hypothetical protein